MHLQFRVGGMKCGACAARVQKAVEALPNIDQAQVNLLTGTLELNAQDKRAVLGVLSCVEGLGFTIEEHSTSTPKTAPVREFKVYCHIGPHGESLAEIQSYPTLMDLLAQEDAILTPSNDGFTLTIKAHKPQEAQEKLYRLADQCLELGLEVRYDQEVYERDDSAATADKPAVRLQDQQKHELHAARVRLFGSLAACIPLMYLSMGSMLGLPLPPATPIHVWIMACLQLILCLVVIGLNADRFIEGGKALIHARPNMDSLISLGAGASLACGLIGLFHITQGVWINGASPASIQSSYHSLYFESAAMILSFIALGSLLELRAKAKTTQALEDLYGLQAPKARLVLDEMRFIVPTSRISVGDRLEVKAGEVIPTDGLILQGQGRLDESFLTGESMPVSRRQGDEIIGASTLTEGWLVLQALRVGEDTSLSEIIALVDRANASKAPLQRLADTISLVFVPCVLGIALITALVWAFIYPNDLGYAASHAIAVLVISCPCALGLATPTALMVGTGRGARSGILIRSAEVLERACKVSAVVFDKTGTLTTQSLCLTTVNPAEEVSSHELLEAAAWIESFSNHPIAQAICSYAQEVGIDPSLTYPKEGNLIHIPGEGIRAPKNNTQLWAGNERLMLRAGVSASMLESFASSHTQAAGAITRVYIAHNQQLLGSLELGAELRPEAQSCIEWLRGQGIYTAMLTGDSLSAAYALQTELQLDDLQAGMLPQDKDAYIQKLRERHVVAMVGDGINDAPALSQADVALAIGSGSDIARNSADILLTRPHLLGVVNSLRLSQACVRIIKENLFWALIYNAICIPLAAGALESLGIHLMPAYAAAAMSASSVCVVSNSLRLRHWKPLEPKKTY